MRKGGGRISVVQLEPLREVLLSAAARARIRTDLAGLIRRVQSSEIA
jgi:hypothetical protein